MTLFSFTTSCHCLGVDSKTLRRWLHAARLACCPHPADARLTCLTLSQLELLAQVHNRPLLLTSPASSPLEPSGASVPASASSLDSDTSPHMQPITLLQQQIASLQTQVAELALALLAVHSSRPSPASPTPLAPDTAPANLSVTTEISVPPAAAASQKRLPAKPSSRTRMLPLIQLRDDASVVVITPSEGIISLLPDSPEWFAWLASIEAFAFDGPTGRFSATRKVRHGERIQAWNLHRSLYGRSCSLYMGQTPTLTLARLQALATAASDRLTSL